MAHGDDKVENGHLAWVPTPKKGIGSFGRFGGKRRLADTSASSSE